MQDFLDFIKDTPTAFHANQKIKEWLIKNDYREIGESEHFILNQGGKYFLSRNMSSLIAFTIPSGQDIKGFNITAAHLDSPTFKLKPNFAINRGNYQLFNTEVYGGPIYSTWFDRPLGIAGRVVVASAEGVEAKLVNFNEPLVYIANLPIHYNRNANKGVELNPQVDTLPIFCDKSFGDVDLTDLICSTLQVFKESILSSDLYLTVLDRGTLIGANKEFVMAPQIDNLECSYGLIKALLAASNSEMVNVCCLFDSEEIGSRTIQGAGGTFLADTLERISLALGKNKEELHQLLASSFMVSADNAQGYHPNHPSKYDENNACYLNRGIVIKNAARGSYSTDAMSSAYFQYLCQKAGVKYQLNTNRSDVLGGSTLGTISLGQVSIPSVDIGLAQLAMHSAYETAGAYDLDYLVAAIKFFYSQKIQVVKDFKITNS